MDGERFDSLTRTLTAPFSRRVTLGGLAAGVLLSLGLALDETAVLAKKKGNKGKGGGKNKKKDKKKNKNENETCRPGSFRPVPCGTTCCAIDETCCGDSASFFFCCAGGDTCRPEGCVNHCFDGEKNLGETGPDCGGTCRDVKKCEPFQECAVDADCQTGVCEARPELGFGPRICMFCRQDLDCDQFNDPERFRCFGNACGQCHLNGDCPRPGQSSTRTVCREVICVECSRATEATDCPTAERPRCVEPVGGGCPFETPCVCGQCGDDVDCPEGQSCDPTGSCFGESCTNGVKDGNETDVDCGGSCPTKCFPNQTCARGSDCQSGLCNAQGRCQCVNDAECAEAFPNFLPICLDAPEVGFNKECTECRDASDCPTGETCQITRSGGQCR